MAMAGTMGGGGGDNGGGGTPPLSSTSPSPASTPYETGKPGNHTPLSIPGSSTATRPRVLSFLFPGDQLPPTTTSSSGSASSTPSSRAALASLFMDTSNAAGLLRGDGANRSKASTKANQRNSSFENLVDRVLPRGSLAHVGSSLPAETLRNAVNKLNDRLKYHLVTSKTHDGGGLSSIFAESMERPLDQTSLVGSDDEDEGEGGRSLGLDEEDEVEDDEEEDNFTIGNEEEEQPRSPTPPRQQPHHAHLDAALVGQVELVLRRSELFAWLPEQILKPLVKHCTVRTLERGQVLFRHGEVKPLASCLIVISGDLSLVVPNQFLRHRSGREQQLVRPSSACDEDDTNTDGGRNEDNEDDEEAETLIIGQGRMVNGISDFVAAIVGEPAEFVGTARAGNAVAVVVCEITHAQLVRFFESYEGVREEMLLRALSLIQRVVFTSIYRLTGRYASSFRNIGSDGTCSGSGSSRLNRASSASLPAASSASTTLWAEVASATLGVPAADLVAFSREKKRKQCAAYVPDDAPVAAAAAAAAAAGHSPPSASASASAATSVIASEFPLILNFGHREGVINHGQGWNPALYIVLSGALEVRTLNFEGDEVGTLQYRAVRGGDVAQLAVITKSFAQWYSPDSSNEYPRNIVQAVGDATSVLKICEQDYFELLERFPDILSLKAREVCRYISPLVHLADCATYFKQVQPTQTVVANGQLVDGMMVILHGRVKFFPNGKDAEGGREYGRGSVLGESSYLTNQPFFGTLQAMRKTNLAYVPKLIVKSVTANYPDSLVHIGRQISRKIFAAQHSDDDQGGNASAKMRTLGRRRRTVAVLPVSPNVPLESFTLALKNAVVAQGRTCAIITGGGVLLNYRAAAFDEMEILSRMQDVEEANDIVFFQLDAWTANDELSKWSKLCIAQADTVLVVVNAGDKPMPCAMEKRSRAVVSSAKRELVVLHVLSDTNKVSFLPRNIREWVECVGNVVQHSHNIRYHPYDAKQDTMHWKSDVRRLARWISGNAIGLVLGGGGARGSAHLSVLRALEHCEVPVDFVGGTSIGALVGGLYSMTGGDYAQVEQLFDRFAQDMSSKFNTYRDLTFPLLAPLKGYQFNRAIVRMFGDVNIEDFWINFYCITTDLTASLELAHRNGFAWKYIRASMTLTGYLPPVCDVQGEGVCHYLVDGGYCDNLPVDAMRKLVGRNGTVVAVDVQSAWKLGGYNYGDELNGWWFLWKWLSPFSVTPDIPTASEIQSHLAYVSCVQRFGQSSQKWNLYIAPALPPSLTTMAFSQSKTIQEACYPAVLGEVQQWLAGEQGERLTCFVGGGGGGACAAVKSIPPASPKTVSGAEEEEEEAQAT